MDDEVTTGNDGENKDEKSISSDLIRGHINTIILRALYDGDKYGYEIMAEIERKSHGQYSLKEPSLYSALKRLEKSGYVTSYWGGSVAGGRRKYFSLTDEGKAVSEQNQSEWEYSRTVIDSLISDKDFDFSNPAPTQVDMRVLRSSTSRVPSREGEGEELDFEPVFEDPQERVRLNEEFEKKSSDLAAEYDQKNAALNEEFEKKNSDLAAEYDQKNAALEEERKALEEQRKAFEDEMKARSEAVEGEQVWREQELAAREQALADERRRLEAMRSEQIQVADAEQEQKEAALAEEFARLDERKRAFEEEAAARRSALDAEESERRRILDEEETARRAKLDAEENERRRAYEEVESVRRAAYEAEEAAKKSTLAAEEAERKRILDEEEASRKRIIEEREQQFNEREAFYNRERNRFSELLRQRDEQIDAERRAHAQELVEQEHRIKQEQEAIFRRREQQLLHKNYLDLVNSPSKEETDATLTYAVPKEVPAEGTTPPSTEYRSVVQHIYAGATQGERETQSAPRARSLDGIDFHDLETRANRDGIRLTTTGGQLPVKKEQDVVNTIHKGKMLFLSAIVLLFVCIIEGAIVMAVRKKYGIPAFFPYIMWAIGIVVLLVTGLAYANRYGARSIRRNGPAIINAVVGYCLSIVIVFIVALSARIDFTSTSYLATFVVVPIIFLFGMVIFGVCYYILTRPKKKQ